jgi:cytoskeletal protein RodZ
MVEGGEKRRLIPSVMSRQHTIVIVVLIAVVAIVILVIALSLGTFNKPTSSNAPTSSGGYNVPYPVSPNITSKNISVTHFSFASNSSGGTTFFVPVTNTGNDFLNGSVNVLISTTGGVPSPNQPYPTNQPPPTPVPNSAYQNSTQIALAPGETLTVEVTVGTPPGFSVNPSNVRISVT